MTRSTTPIPHVVATAQPGKRTWSRRAGRVAIVAWAAIGVAVLIALALALLSTFRLIVIPLVLGIFPTIVLAPANRALRRIGAPAALASLASIVGLLGMLGLFAYTTGRAIRGQLDDLAASLEKGYDEARTWLADDSPIEIRLGPWDDLAEQLRSWAIDGSSGISATSVVGTTVDIAAGVLLTLVATFFYLKDGSRLIQWLPNALPQPWSRRSAEGANAAWHGIAGYFRGQLIVALVDAVAIGIGLLAFGVPLAGPLTILVFLGGFFPIIGATASGLVASLVALADGGIGTALGVLGLVVVVQQLEGNVLEPYIVGRATQLHPLIVILALAAGGAQGGLLGAFLGVPIAAAIAAVTRYAVAERDASRHLTSSEEHPA